MNGNLNWRLYTIIETIINIKWVKLVKKKEFLATALDLNDETFVIYMASFISYSVNIHLFCRA